MSRAFWRTKVKAKMKFFFNSSQLSKEIVQHAQTYVGNIFGLLENQNQTNTYRGGLHGFFRVTRQLQINIQTRL